MQSIWPALLFFGGPPWLSPYSMSRSSPACFFLYVSCIRKDNDCFNSGAAVTRVCIFLWLQVDLILEPCSIFDQVSININKIANYRVIVILLAACQNMLISALAQHSIQYIAPLSKPTLQLYSYLSISLRMACALSLNVNTISLKTKSWAGPPQNALVASRHSWRDNSPFTNIPVCSMRLHMCFYSMSHLVHGSMKLAAWLPRLSWAASKLKRHSINVENQLSGLKHDIARQDTASW